MVQRKANLASLYLEVAAASNILVVGGGIVGVELAGELAFLPNIAEKKVHLAVKGAQLMKQFDSRAALAAEEFLLSKGIEIMYNTTYDDSQKKDYDLVLLCTGEKYNSDFLKTEFSSSIASNGQIFVNDFFQLSS